MIFSRVKYCILMIEKEQLILDKHINFVVVFSYYKEDSF